MVFVGSFVMCSVMHHIIMIIIMMQRMHLTPVALESLCRMQLHSLLRLTAANNNWINKYYRGCTQRCMKRKDLFT